MATRAQEGRGMRTFVLLVAAVILSVSALPMTATPATAASTIPELKLTILGEQNGTTYQFSPSRILLPQVPILMNITFINNQTAGSTVRHTFSIDSSGGKTILDYDLVAQQNVTFDILVNSMTNITWNGTSFTPAVGPTGGIKFYCVYHLPGMVGELTLAGAPSTTGTEQNGVFLRAYWIGMIGIAAMLVWIGISYYIIKGSTTRFKDNREHVRKGLP